MTVNVEIFNGALQHTEGNGGRGDQDQDPLLDHSSSHSESDPVGEVISQPGEHDVLQPQEPLQHHQLQQDQQQQQQHRYHNHAGYVAGPEGCQTMSLGHVTDTMGMHPNPSYSTAGRTGCNSMFPSGSIAVATLHQPLAPNELCTEDFYCSKNPATINDSEQGDMIALQQQFQMQDMQRRCLQRQYKLQQLQRVIRQEQQRTHLGVVTAYLFQRTCHRYRYQVQSDPLFDIPLQDSHFRRRPPQPALRQPARNETAAEPVREKTIEEYRKDLEEYIANNQLNDGCDIDDYDIDDYIDGVLENIARIIGFVVWFWRRCFGVLRVVVIGIIFWTCRVHLLAALGISNDTRFYVTKRHSSILGASTTMIVAVAGLIGLALFGLRRLQVVRKSSGSVSSGSVASINDFSIATD